MRLRRTRFPKLHDAAQEPRVGRLRRIGRWWMGSTPALMVSSIFGLLLVAALGYLLIFPPPPVPVAQASAGTAIGTQGTTSPTTPATTFVQAACADQPAVQVTPETLVLTTYTTSWYPIGAMLAPRSDTGGPLQPGRCFTRTPEGALYAVATRAATEARDAGVAGRRFSGYQWLSYDPDLATVSLAAAPLDGANNGPPLARTFTTTWSGNDWDVMVLNQPAQALDGLRAFTPWGGV